MATLTAISGVSATGPVCFLVEADGARPLLAAVADAAAGEAARCVARWAHDAAPAIIFIGYSPPRTPAERLTQSGSARHMRWNVHPRLSACMEFVRRTGAKAVLPAFGDARHLEAWRSAFAPASVHLKCPVVL